MPSARSTIRARRYLRKAGDEAVQELAHDLVGERVEREVVTDRRESTSPLRSVPSGRDKHEEEDGVVARPLEEVVQEVDHAGVGPLQVLDDHDDRQVLGQSFEEQTPAREELLLREHLLSRKSQQLAEAGGDELPVGGVSDPALEAGPQSLGDDLLWVLLADLEPCPDHLRQRPVADPLAIGEAAPGVPEHGPSQAVDVLFELPGEARLADAGDPGDEHHARRVALGRGVEELLDEAELPVTSDEGRLDDARALRAGDGGHDPGRLEEPDRLGLSLQLVLAGVHVGDRSRRGGPRRLVDVAAPRRCGRLDAGGGVHPVADDEALLGGLGRGRATGHDPDAGLEVCSGARCRRRRRPRRARVRPARPARRRPPLRPGRPRPP